MRFAPAASRFALAITLAASYAYAQPRRADAGAPRADAGRPQSIGTTASAPRSDAGVAATSPTPPAGPPDANRVVAQLQAFYDRTTDFEADFIQVSRTRLTGGEQRRNGHVRFKRPGRMRWDYQSPTGDVIVSDGTTLWAYEAAARQAVQSTMQQSQLPSALSFLTGTGRLANDFTFRMLDARRYQYPNGYVLEARPINPNPSFERIVFYVEGGHFQVARTVVIDAQGNQNRFDFVNPRVNMNHPETLFQWRPPAGTQVVRP
jgi:outer membrane lipoprotein carrier protein